MTPGWYMINFSLYRQYFREPRTQFNTSDHAGANCYKGVSFHKQNDFVKNCRNRFRSLMGSHQGLLKLRAQIVLDPFLIICWFVSPPVNYYVWKLGVFFI